MDREDTRSEFLQSSNWEVYKDAFAPPQPGRRVKPWERAPVPAHAPRLQGQKVWKKVNIKPQSQRYDKENHNFAQAELEKAGMGARKRPRMIGQQENIGDAPWKKGSLDDEQLGNRTPSPKMQRFPMELDDADAFVVPRKRTNANHLITPKKPGWKTPLMDQTQATFATHPEGLEITHLSHQGTAQNSHNSPAKSSPQKIPLNDLDHNEDRVAAPTEKPVRRRKSLRRSTRGLTLGKITEQPNTAPADEAFAHPALVSAALVVESTAKVAIRNPELVAPSVEDAQKDSIQLRHVSDSIEAPAMAIFPEVSERDAVEAIIQELVPLKATAEILPESQHEAGLPAQGQLASPILVEDLEDSVMHLHETLPAQTSGEACEEIPNFEVEPAVATGGQFITGANQTPQPSVPSSIELGTETHFVSPTKSAGTPRSRRKTPQQRGSRRSTRSTRANSVHPENISGKQATENEASKAENASPTSSPIKPRKNKISTTEVSTPREHDAVVKVHTSAGSNKCQHTEHTDVSFKPSVEIETQGQEQESLETKAVMTMQSSNSISHSENFSGLEPVLEENSLGAETGGEDQNLAGAAILVNASPLTHAGGEDPSVAVTATLDYQITVESGSLNIQDDVIFKVGAGIATTQTEDERVFSLSKPMQSGDPGKDDIDPGLDEPGKSSVEVLEVLGPIPISISTENLAEDLVKEPSDDLPETSTHNLSTTELVEVICENAPANAFEHDDTDMLRNFLTRVKANKAAKAGATIPKRKRSLPHSPIRLPLGSQESVLSPSSPKIMDDFDVSLPAEPSTKRKRNDANLGDDEINEPKSIRRSGRTRLPVKAAPLAAPSFIPVRRLGQEGDSTVTLRRNEEKELAALTRVNTRKNKGVALPPLQVLAKQAEEKDDPASRHRALKEVFDEKAQKQKKAKKRKTVVWAEELAQFQTEEGMVVVLEEQKEMAAPIEEKKNAVKVGVRSKMTLGMAVNGTPAPKRKMRGRS